MDMQDVDIKRVMGEPLTDSQDILKSDLLLSVVKKDLVKIAESTKIEDITVDEFKQNDYLREVYLAISNKDIDVGIRYKMETLVDEEVD